MTTLTKKPADKKDVVPSEPADPNPGNAPDWPDAPVTPDAAKEGSALEGGEVSDAMKKAAQDPPRERKADGELKEPI